MAKKTYEEKLQHMGDLPKIEEISDAKMIQKHGGSRMLIAPPIFYDRAMRRVPAGKLVMAGQIRAHLAKEGGADFTCPLTAGIFINLAANASEERGGDPTPYWRTLKAGGELNAKYPGGTAAQSEKLIREGHSVVQRGKRFFVQNYEAALMSL